MEGKKESNKGVLKERRKAGKNEEKTVGRKQLGHKRRRRRKDGLDGNKDA